jgi:hypothetical protein
LGKVIHELTLASLSGGTCCWMAVAKYAFAGADPAPRTNAASATQGAVACSASGMSGSA